MTKKVPREPNAKERARDRDRERENENKKQYSKTLNEKLERKEKKKRRMRARYININVIRQKVHCTHSMNDVFEMNGATRRDVGRKTYTIHRNTHDNNKSFSNRKSHKTIGTQHVDVKEGTKGVQMVRIVYNVHGGMESIL